MLGSDAAAPDGLMNIHDFARRVSLSVPTVRRAIHRGELPHYRLGRLIRFGEKHLKEWLAEHERAAETSREERA